MRRFRLLVATAAVAVVVACGGDSGSNASEDAAGDSTSPSPTPTTSFPSPDPEPTVEPTTPGTGGGGSPSVDLPGLPIGGGDPTPVSDFVQCASVAWSGPPDLPAGLEVEIRAFSLPRHFAETDEGCSEFGPPCRAAGFRFDAGGATCSVAIVWDQTPIAEETVLQLEATEGIAVCTEQSLCDAFLADVKTERAENGPQTIDLVRPEPSDDPTDDPTDEPTDDPTDDPTDEPTDDPSDDPTDAPGT